ncbi:MAG: hypothetical protein QOF33_3166 [Thermomicrobiales bacterium]|jgi:hypothetical protein|nr:hypothetical protein [Thermomicrobiales bacterium]
MREPDITLTGRFERGQERRYVHLPFAVPTCVRQIHLRYDYTDRISSNPSVGGGNTLDVGLFDEQGIEPGSPGFRGWSGSERLAFTIDESWATPPYRPGAIGPGVWHVLLGPYKVGPRGLDYRVEIWLDAGIPRDVPDILLHAPSASPKVPPAAEPGWVRGDLHCHSLYSDGDSWPSELLVRAAELGLDFLAVTDHNSALFPERPNEPPGLPFLLPGIEVTTYGGHWNVWGLRQWFDFRDPTAPGVEKEMRRAIAAGGFVSINHPRPWGPDWDYEGIDANHAVEVWNGPWSRLNPICVAFWEEQLAQGRLVVAVGGSDTHELRGGGQGLLPPPKLAEPTTWIEVGPRLDTASLLAGLRRGRCFVSASPRGPQLYCDHVDGEMTVRVVGGVGAKLQVLAGTTLIAELDISDDDWSKVFGLPDNVPYVRAQVVDQDQSMLAFANPTWVGDRPSG